MGVTGESWWLGKGSSGKRSPSRPFAVGIRMCLGIGARHEWAHTHTRIHTCTHTHAHTAGGSAPAPGLSRGRCLSTPHPGGEGARRGREGLAGVGGADVFTWFCAAVSPERRGGRAGSATSGWFKKKKKKEKQKNQKQQKKAETTKPTNSAILCSPQAEQYKGLLYLRLSGGWERQTESQGERDGAPPR